eukprot:1925678-Lingulodinium_polyedra.AAC.1
MVSDAAATEAQGEHGHAAAEDGACVHDEIEAWRAGEAVDARGDGAALYRVCWRRRWRAKL